MTTVFEKNHDSGGALSSHWTVSDSSGSMSLIAAAGLNGSAYGVKCDHDAPQVGSSDLTTTYTALSGTDMRFRLWLNLDNLSHSGSGTTGFLQVDVKTNTLFRVEIETDGAVADGYEVNFQYKADGDLFFTDAIADIDLPAGEFCIEFTATRESSDGAADGTMEGFVDGSSVGSVSNIENFNNWASISTARVRFNQIPAGQSPSGFIYVDEIILDDDASADLGCTPNYSYIQSVNGLAKNAIAVSADGDNLFIPLEDNTSGNQIVFKATRPSAPTVSAIYEPAAGSAANAIATGDPDKMIFFGNFGTDIGVIEHTISTDVESDISPTSIGADEIQPLAIDPSDINHIVAVNVTDQDALETEDGGTTWATLNATLGQTVEAMGLIWLGALFPVGGFIGGDDGVDENLEYTPNEFANLREDTSAALKAVTKITGIDLTTS